MNGFWATGPRTYRLRAYGLPFLAACACAVLASCAVGPNFQKPAAPDVTDYAPHAPATTDSVNGVAGGDAQRFANGKDIIGDWWTLFHSKQLDDLIGQALEKNHDLKSAEAALKVAHENVLAQRGSFYPNVSAGFSASRHQDPPGALAAVPATNAFLYNLYTPQVSVSYMPDVFGLNRRTVESLQAQQDQVRYQMIATYNTLTSNVVVAAIQMASLQMQIDATREIIDSNTKLVDILQYQFKKGVVSGLEVAAQESQLAQAKAALPTLAKQLDQERDLLAVLCGHYPSEAPDDKFDLSNLKLPDDLPLSLPSTLVAQRPDVLQAQEAMHAASAQIGIAEANRLPNLLLTGNAGSTALELNQLFKSGTGFWSLAADLTTPIFDGGTLMHQERAAKAAYVQASEQYRSTVLTAFQNVADSLAALEHDAEGLKAAAAAASAAKVTLDLSQYQWHAGTASYLSLLSAEQADQQAKINLVLAQASRYADTAALFQALGGGWWNQADIAQDINGK
ncbi:MAG TPA: efflux transporter outer membrane subunit [Rudaea sp.]|jgi:NodT family efflux transporter outer membrane factor (OMF) lipoprotein|nr:efflux transporter outer membrane subunit [Rudaea sp.]